MSVLSARLTARDAEHAEVSAEKTDRGSWLSAGYQVGKEMKRLLVVTLILGLSGLVSVGQSPDHAAQEREALCKTVACREATTIKLKVDEQRYAEFSFPRGPFVSEGFISILNGERFGVEFDEKDGRLTAPRYVKEIAHADRTISFELSSLENGTALKIANPFSKAVVYDCLIQHYKQPGFSRTNVLTVGARLTSYETWPYPVTQVLISNAHYRSQSTGGIGPGNGIGSHADPNNHRAVVKLKPEPEGAAKSSAPAHIVITLKAIFRSNGTVTDIKVIGVQPEHLATQQEIDDLAKKAVQAAKGIKFEPAIKDGHAVSQPVKLEYTFNFDGDDPKPEVPNN